MTFVTERIKFPGHVNILYSLLHETGLGVLLLVYDWLSGKKMPKKQKENIDISELKNLILKDCKVKGPLKKNLFSLYKMRNEVSHPEKAMKNLNDKNLKIKIKSLRKIMEDVIKLAGDQANKNPKEVNAVINDIPLEMTEVQERCNGERANKATKDGIDSKELEIPEGIDGDMEILNLNGNIVCDLLKTCTVPDVKSSGSGEVSKNAFDNGDQTVNEVLEMMEY